MARPRKSAGKLTPPPETEPGQHVAKHRRVFDHLLASIQSGELKSGDRLPSEAELGAFSTLRASLWPRRSSTCSEWAWSRADPGAGTHVQGQHQVTGRTFGLLIPELGLTEIFEPICHGMMRTPFARPDALLWGNSSTSVRETAKEAEQMVHSFIAQKVAGVFFAPLELTGDKDAVNRRIARALERAQIPVVLLDRCYMPYPERSAHDLVGVDNRRAGFIATAHLLGLGVGVLVFLGEEYAANTVDARITGFHEALRNFGVNAGADPVWRGSPRTIPLSVDIMDAARPEAIVCANDLTAARLMQMLLGFGPAHSRRGAHCRHGRREICQPAARGPNHCPPELCRHRGAGHGYDAGTTGASRAAGARCAGTHQAGGQALLWRAPRAIRERTARDTDSLAVLGRRAGRCFNVEAGVIINFARRAHDHNWELDPITRSLLDTDFYKLLMLQFIWKHFPKTRATFTLRQPHLRRIPLGEIVNIDELREQLESTRQAALPQVGADLARGQHLLWQARHLRARFP